MYGRRIANIRTRLRRDRSSAIWTKQEDFLRNSVITWVEMIVDVWAIVNVRRDIHRHSQSIVKEPQGESFLDPRAICIPHAVGNCERSRRRCSLVEKFLLDVSRRRVTSTRQKRRELSRANDSSERRTDTFCSCNFPDWWSKQLRLSSKDNPTSAWESVMCRKISATATDVCHLHF